MESFKVWTALEIKGNALEQMRRFALFTEKATDYIKLLNKEMYSLNQRFAILDNRLNRLAPHSERLLSLFKGLNRSANLNNKSFERYNSQLLRNNTQTELLSNKTAVLSERTEILNERIKSVSISSNLASGAMMRMNAASKISNATGIGGNRSSRSNHPHTPYHALSHAGLGKSGSSAAAIGSVARFGGPLLAAGLGAGIVLHKGYEANIEYTKGLAQFQALGFNANQLKDVQKFTHQSSPGISPIRQIEALKDAQMATRKYSDAKMLSPELAKFQFVADAMFTGLSDKQLQNAIRIAEFRGGADPKKIKDELTTVAQMYVTSGGTIDPTAFLPFFTRYQGANKLSRSALLALEPTLQEYKPTLSGTALQTLYGRLHGGIKLSERDEGFFESIGLFKNGKLTKKYANDLASDPEAFYEKDWIPMLNRHGIYSPEAISQANIHLGRTPSQLFSVLGKNTEKSARARAQIPQLMGMDQLMQTAFKTESGSALRFMQALQSLVLAIGKFSSPMVISGLNALSAVMERMAKVFSSNTQRQDLDKAIGVKTNPIDWSKVGNKLGSLGNQLESYYKNSITSLHSGKMIQVTSVTNIDGHKIAKTVSKHQASAMNRGGTQSAPSGVNPMMTPQPAGINNFGGFN